MVKKEKNEHVTPEYLSPKILIIPLSLAESIELKKENRGMEE